MHKFLPALLVSTLVSCTITTPVSPLDPFDGFSPTLRFEHERPLTFDANGYGGVYGSQDHYGIEFGVRKYLLDVGATEFRPYVGVGLDAVYASSSNVDTGGILYSAVPGVGIRYSVNESFALDIRAGYKVVLIEDNPGWVDGSSFSDDFSGLVIELGVAF
jgi:hypothetical protein